MKANAAKVTLATATAAAIVKVKKEGKALF
jgi:hypothetical protein